MKTATVTVGSVTAQGRKPPNVSIAWLIEGGNR